MMEVLYDSVRKMLPYAHQVALSDDVNWLRMAQLNEHHASENGAWCHTNVMRTREAQTYAVADFVIAITENDRELIVEDLAWLAARDAAGDAADADAAAVAAAVREKVQVLRFVSTGVHPVVVPFDQRDNDLLFVGYGYNPTNIISFQWFYKNVLPLVRKQFPDTVVHLVGRGWDRQYKSSPSIPAHGEVPDLQSIVNSVKVFICPVTIGTGLNTKSLVALEYGLPLVRRPAARFVLMACSLRADAPASLAHRLRQPRVLGGSSWRARAPLLWLIRPRVWRARLPRCSQSESMGRRVSF